MEIDLSTQQKKVFEAISSFPSQFSYRAEEMNLKKTSGNFQGAVICGMGGSALPGDVLRTWLKKTGKEILLELHRNFYLPKSAGQNKLVVCVSYSGNTEETVSSINEALKNSLSLACIASNGKVADICEKNQLPFIRIPSGLMPRQALGYQFSALVRILNNYGLVSDEMVSEVASLDKKLDSLGLEEQGKVIAKKLDEKIPLIYSSRDNLVLARIFKINFNENSKTPAFFNYFPELDHNELAGFSLPRNDFKAVILRDEDDFEEIKKQMEITAGLLKKRKVETEFVDIKGQDALTKIFSSIILSSWASYYLAKEKKVGPWSIEIVEELKKELAKD